MKKDKQIKVSGFTLAWVVCVSLGMGYSSPIFAVAKLSPETDAAQAEATPPPAEPASVATPEAQAAPPSSESEVTTSANASPSGIPSLEQQLNALNVPENQAPTLVSTEKLYAVQSRYIQLGLRHELSIGGGKNFTSDSFIDSQNVDLGYRFYISNRWFLNLNGSLVFNDLSSGAQALYAREKLLPDVAFTRARVDLMLGYQLFYGKFRLTMDNVFYFDQYVSLGPAWIDMDKGADWGVAGELGFAFWFGKNFSFRLGLRDYFVREVRFKGADYFHNLIGMAQAGWVFGG